MSKLKKNNKPVQMILERGGLIHTSEAIRMGLHPRDLYALRDNGILEQVTRGVYRSAKSRPLTQPDLVAVFSRCPRAVVCLVSSLAFYGLTTQIPRHVSIALAQGERSPMIKEPPVSVYRFSHEALVAGVEEHLVDGIKLKVFSVEKTLADCFKFRNKLGMDVVLEALKFYKKRKRPDVKQLLRYARICRVEKIMRPYLEAIL